MPHLTVCSVVIIYKAFLFIYEGTATFSYVDNCTLTWHLECRVCAKKKRKKQGNEINAHRHLEGFKDNGKAILVHSTVTCYWNAQ